MSKYFGDEISNKDALFFRIVSVFTQVLPDKRLCKCDNGSQPKRGMNQV